MQKNRKEGGNSLNLFYKAVIILLPKSKIIVYIG